jgi:arginase
VPIGRIQQAYAYEDQPNPSPTPHAKNITAFVPVVQNIAAQVSQVLQRNRRSFVLAGDHSTAVGSIAGLKKAHPDKRLGVVWLDAHADIHSPYTTPSGDLHGMPLSAATGQPNLGQMRNDITQTEALHWETVEQLASIMPMVHPKDIAFVGIRDLEIEEKKLLERQRSLNLYAQDIDDMSSDIIIRKIDHHLQHCDFLYISFDVDCLDAKAVPGTGTPVGQGPDTEKITRVLQYYWQHPKTLVMEMAEVNPELDQDGKTVALAQKILEKLFLR